MPGVDNDLHSTMVGTLTITGGTFAPYFPNGSDVKVKMRFTSDLEILVNRYGFVTAEFWNGTLNGGCAEEASDVSVF